MQAGFQARSNRWILQHALNGARCWLGLMSMDGSLSYLGWEFSQIGAVHEEAESSACQWSRGESLTYRQFPASREDLLQEFRHCRLHPVPEILHNWGHALTYAPSHSLSVSLRLEHPHLQPAMASLQTALLMPRKPFSCTEPYQRLGGRTAGWIHRGHHSKFP